MTRIVRIGISTLVFAMVITTSAAADNRFVGNTVAFSATEFVGPSRPYVVIIRPRHRYLRPNAKRYCRSWLTTKYRPSGPVIMPEMHCWWH